MVTIPTTDRQFYDTQAKESGLATYSKALAPSVELLGKVFHEQEKLKMQALKQQASIDMATVTAEWRKQNALNPNDPEKLKELNAQYDDIIQQAKEQIDPYYRNEFEVLGTGVKNSFALKNSTWAVSQRGQNIKGYAGLIGDNTAKQVYELVRAGDVDGAFASWKEGRETLFNQQGLGEVDTAKIIATTDNKSAQYFIYGLAENDPEKALHYLNTEEFRKILTPQQYDAIETKVKKKVFEKDYALAIENPNDPEITNAFIKKYPNKTNAQKSIENEGARLSDLNQIKSSDEVVRLLNIYSVDDAITKLVEKNPEDEQALDREYFVKTATLYKKIIESKLTDKEKKIHLQSLFNIAHNELYKNNYKNIVDYRRGVISAMLNVQNKYKEQHMAYQVQKTGLGGIGTFLLNDLIYKNAPDDVKNATKSLNAIKGLFGTTNMDEISEKIKEIGDRYLIKAIELANENPSNWDKAFEMLHQGNVAIAQYLNPDIDLNSLNKGDEFPYIPTGEVYTYLGVKNGAVILMKPKGSQK